MEIVQACFVVADIASVSEGVEERKACGVGDSLVASVLDGSDFAENVVIITHDYRAVFINDVYDVSLKVLDVEIHIAAEREGRGVSGFVVVESSYIKTIVENNIPPFTRKNIVKKQNIWYYLAII